MILNDLFKIILYFILNYDLIISMDLALPIRNKRYIYVNLVNYCKPNPIENKGLSLSQDKSDRCLNTAFIVDGNSIGSVALNG